MGEVSYCYAKIYKYTELGEEFDKNYGRLY